MKKHFQSSWHEYLIVLLIVLFSIFICYLIQNFVGYRVLSFVLLFVVSVSAFIYGTGPVLMASTLSALIWNFLFIPPHFTLHITNTEDLLMFIMFFIVALLNGVLTSQVRRREFLLKQKEERSRALYELSRTLSEENDISKLKQVIEAKLGQYFGIEAIVYFNDEIPDLNVADYESFVLQGSHLRSGMIYLQKPVSFSDEQLQFWETCRDQIAGKFEREILREMAKKAYLLGESDKLYKTLFNSVSHEFRIPVTTIMGATDTLLAEKYPEEVQQELLREINTASVRLNQLVENLLNISRLESGHLRVKTDWFDLHDLINKVIQTLSKELLNYEIRVEMPDDLPLVKIDFGLLEQVLQNILLNITQYVPVNTAITICIKVVDPILFIQIRDEGPGFPEKDIRHVFEKFYRGSSVKTGGTGLGLSIVKGFVEAHQGEVQIENHAENGAIFNIRIPVEVSSINITD